MKNTSTSKPLPAVTIGDKSLDRGRKREEGWAGLVPGVSTLDAAIQTLGAPCGTSELSNGCIYNFKDGTIRITIPESKKEISRIFISSAANAPSALPETAESAIKLFGNLIVRTVTPHDVIMERPNMRICCDPMTESLKIKWMEIFLVQS